MFLLPTPPPLLLNEHQLQHMQKICLVRQDLDSLAQLCTCSVVGTQEGVSSSSFDAATCLSPKHLLTADPANQLTGKRYHRQLLDSAAVISHHCLRASSFPAPIASSANHASPSSSSILHLFIRVALLSRRTPLPGVPLRCSFPTYNPWPAMCVISLGIRTVPVLSVAKKLAAPRPTPTASAAKCGLIRQDEAD